MKLKTLQQKPIYAVALVFCMIAPMLMALSPVSAQSTTGVFSAVESGTTNVNSISVPTSPNPINTTVSIDIRIDNASNVWGWTIFNVSWNTAVLHLKGVTEGPFLADNTGPNSPTLFIGNSPALWDNNYGLINGGLSEAISTEDTAINSSGVVATLTFLVIGNGISPVAIAGGNLRANSNDTAGVNVNCNSASVAVPASISLVASGTQNSTIIWSAHQSPINQTFQVDVRINATNVWGWNIGVTWDPSVLNLINVTEGSYLDQSGSTLFLPGYVDNIDGLVRSGISDAYVSYMTANASSGVLATLTFKIISNTYALGPSSIGLTAGTPATLLNSAYPHQAVNPVILNNASYTWPRIPGDINGNGTVNILDAILLASMFGSHGPNYDYPGEPASPNWNPNADLNGDNVVNMLDAILLANNFGQSIY